MVFKEIILEKLTILADEKKSKNEIFRYRAYKNAIQSIKDYDNDINDIKDLDKISGLSKTGSIRKKIIELINTGNISQIQNIGNEINIIQELSNIYGVGPSKANELVNKYEIKSIEDLKNKYKNDNSILNNKQKIGLDYYEDLLKRIPQKEMIKHEDFIIKFIKNIDINNDLIYEITGSYRRGAIDSGDIDVLCSTKNNNTELFNKIIEDLESEKYIQETLAKGDKKFMGICKLPRYRSSRRLDMIYTKKEYYPFALLYFTGSGQFNVDMRNHAITLGYSLSEYGLKKDGEFIDNNGKLFETEEDIFKFLRIKYIKPEDRKAGILEDNLF
jgi:DNA polymerase beta